MLPLNSGKQEQRGRPSCPVRWVGTQNSTAPQTPGPARTHPKKIESPVIRDTTLASTKLMMLISPALPATACIGMLAVFGLAHANRGANKHKGFQDPALTDARAIMQIPPLALPGRHLHRGGRSAPQHSAMPAPANPAADSNSSRDALTAVLALASPAAESSQSLICQRCQPGPDPCDGLTASARLI